MWNDTDNKIFEYLEKMTPELHELHQQCANTEILRNDIQRLQFDALHIKSKVWTPEAVNYVESVADNAATALKSLDDKIKILNLKIKALEAAL